MTDLWTRRRAAVAAEEAALETPAPAPEYEGKSDEEILTELDLPDPDTLESGDDVRAFMAKAVPQRLKTRALRRLWRLNPTLANLDGLVDYGEDFTDSANVVENLQTAYQVGKGMLAHLEKLAADAAAKEANEAETDTAEPIDVAALEVTEAPLEEIAAPEPAPAFEPDPADPTPLRSARRMQFTYVSDSSA